MAKRKTSALRHAQQKGTALTKITNNLGQLSRSGQTFDLVVVDPPSFAKKESEVEGALHSYVRLVRLAVPLVVPGGILLMASCSSRIRADLFFEIIEKELKQTGRRFTLLEKTFHDVDHPIGFREGAYLKGGYYKLF